MNKLKTKDEISQLKKRIAELESRKTITFMGFLRFLIFIGISELAYLNLNYIFYAWEYLEVQITPELVELPHLLIVYPIIIEYGLVCLSAIALVSWIKRGWSNIKGLDDDGLIFGLIFGLMFGIVGMMAGLIFGLMVGLTVGIVGMIAGLIVGLIVGLTVGIVGMIAGLVEEFDQKRR